MATVKTFEDLEIWKEGMSLACQIYAIFKQHKDFGFKDQIQRAAVSIPSNIAEGFERNTSKEFVQFLYYAKGSCGELRTLIHLAGSLNYIEKQDGDTLIEATKALSSKIYKLITYRKNLTQKKPLQ